MEIVKLPFSKVLVDDYEDAPMFTEFFDETKMPFNPQPISVKSNQSCDE